MSGSPLPAETRDETGRTLDARDEPLEVVMHDMQGKNVRRVFGHSFVYRDRNPDHNPTNQA